VLNAVDLKIENVRVTAADGTIYASIETIYLPELEVAHFLFAKSLPACDAVLEMDFTGELNDKMKGFYRSKYVNGSEERYAAVTQFEATDARRCFPCWDEPAIKATYDIILTIPLDRVGLSNMPVIKEEKLENNLKRLTFAKSPIMSTYRKYLLISFYCCLQ
jgi:puromycin-sensitive aminopeptidase